ncbi:hypothetical protein GGX14DRAFT_656931, partial [Mycena pura]
IVQKILKFLNTSLPPLIPGEKHVGHANTREPIPYDYHMPPWLQFRQLKYDPVFSTTLTSQFIETLGKRKSIVDKSMDVDPLIHIAAFQIKQIVPHSARHVVGEPSVHAVQNKIHGISGPFATISCFDIDNGEIDRFLPVFTSFASGESNTITDSVVGCQFNAGDTEEQWGSLWPSVTHLSEPFFHVLYTEEYKNIRAGNPRVILGIYIILWCLEKDYLKTFWPENDCDGCSKFKKSHKAAEEFDGTVPKECPLDASSATKALATDFDELRMREEINRMVALATVYDEKYSILRERTGSQTEREREPGSASDPEPEPEPELKTETQRGEKRTRRALEDSESDEDQIVFPFKDLLEDAMNLAISELV